MAGQAINFGWEAREDYIRRAMKISPKRKLEWLYEINEFFGKYAPKKSRIARMKLRALRSRS